MCATGCRIFLAAVVGVAVAGAIPAAPALAKSAGEESAKGDLPDVTIRLVVAPTWKSGLSPVSTEARETVELEMGGGRGVLATVGTGDKDSWHAEAEVGLRKTTPNPSERLGPLDTSSLMANGYYGFRITEKFDGYVGTGVGIAWHREEDRGSDLGFGYQFMLGVGYELSEKLTANFGIRYIATQAAAIGRVRLDYGHPEVEVGLGLEF